MDILDFGLLDISQQEELIGKYGKFIRTEATGDYLHDIYIYDAFYVLFYYLLNEGGTIKSKCFLTLGHAKPFIDLLNNDVHL